MTVFFGNVRADAQKTLIREAIRIAVKNIRDQLGCDVTPPIVVNVASDVSSSGVDGNRWVTFWDKDLPGSYNAKFQALVTHELVHCLQHDLLGESPWEAGVPRWFFEGMACHVAGQGQSWQTMCCVRCDAWRQVIPPLTVPGAAPQVWSPVVDVAGGQFSEEEMNGRYAGYELAIDLFLKLSNQPMTSLVTVLQEHAKLNGDWPQAFRNVFGRGDQDEIGDAFWLRASIELPERFNPATPPAAPAPSPTPAAPPPTGR